MPPREPSAVVPAPIRSVAVIGAGEQGRAFALRCARAGYLTVLEDVMPAKLRKAGQELAAAGDPNAATLLSFASTVEDAVREADVAIDFVPDELESKLEIFSMLDRMAPPKTILCTPTRTQSITDLGSCTYRSERCVALDASSEGVNTELLRIVQGRKTLGSVVASVREWLIALGAEVEIVQETTS